MQFCGSFLFYTVKGINRGFICAKDIFGKRKLTWIILGVTGSKWVNLDPTHKTGKNSGFESELQSNGHSSLQGRYRHFSGEKKIWKKICRAYFPPPTGVPTFCTGTPSNPPIHCFCPSLLWWHHLHQHVPAAPGSPPSPSHLVPDKLWLGFFAAVRSSCVTSLLSLSSLSWAPHPAEPLRILS